MANGISLHIGVNKVDPNHYGGWSGPLNACEADAHDIKNLAELHGYEAQILLTRDATRRAVLNALDNAAGKLKKGDIFLLSYSGHGGQVPDINGDEDDDVDETWCLFDGELIDDELYLKYCQFAENCRILVLSDSCHSGTVARAPGGVATAPTEGPLAEELGTVRAAVRCMPVAAAVRTYHRNRAMYDGLQKELPREKPKLKASLRLISGCQDNQLSLDGTFNGLFTGRLLKVWNSGRFRGNYMEFHRKIVQRMPPEQTPNHFVIGTPNEEFDEQRPFIV